MPRPSAKTPSTKAPPADCIPPYPREALFQEDGPIDPRFVDDAVRAVMRALPHDPHEDELYRSRRQYAAMQAISAFYPRDEIEFIYASQAVSAYHAATACWRLGMNGAEPNGENTRHFAAAASAMRTFDTLVKALERRQGRPAAPVALPRDWGAIQVRETVQIWADRVRHDSDAADEPPRHTVARHTVDGRTLDGLGHPAAPVVQAGEDAPVPAGGDVPEPLGGDAPVPLDRDAPVPVAGSAPTAVGGSAPVPAGVDAPVPAGGEIPQPAGGGAPAPARGNAPVPIIGKDPGPPGGNDNAPDPVWTPDMIRLAKVETRPKPPAIPGVQPDGSIIVPADPTPEQEAYIGRRLIEKHRDDWTEDLLAGRRITIRPLRPGDRVP